MGALTDKVAIVTGAAQGVGRCHAELLAAEGAAVVVNDLSPVVDEVAASIRAAGGRAVAHRGSVSDWAQAEALVARAVAEFGDLHILVNNAGFIRDAMSFSMEESQFDSVVEVHLKGHFAPAHFAAVHWRNAAKQLGEEGTLPARRIINTTSESGLFGGPGQGNYGSAKGGIITMTLVLARELARYNVTVNCIAPRARTPMTEVNPKFAKPESGQREPDGGLPGQRSCVRHQRSDVHRSGRSGSSHSPDRDRQLDRRRWSVLDGGRSGRGQGSTLRWRTGRSARMGWPADVIAVQGSRTTLDPTRRFPRRVTVA